VLDNGKPFAGETRTPARFSTSSFQGSSFIPKRVYETIQQGLGLPNRYVLDRLNNKTTGVFSKYILKAEGKISSIGEHYNSNPGAIIIRSH
jgi:hypothetical protein